MALVTPPASVAPAELITSAWGNAVADGISGLWSRHAVRLADVNEPFAASNLTTISWATELQDTDGYHAAGSASIIVPNADLAGAYMISGRLVRAAGNWSNSYVRVTIAGVAYDFAGVATDRTAFGMCVELGSGTTVQVQAFNGGSTTTVDSVLTMYRMPFA